MTNQTHATFGHFIITQVGVDAIASVIYAGKSIVKVTLARFAFLIDV